MGNKWTITESTVTEYHFVLTAQFPHPRGVQVFTSSGTLNLTPRATRAEAFDFVRNDMRERTGLTGDPDVLFFSLEPNRLAPFEGSEAA
jgi:hypothetical protein